MFNIKIKLVQYLKLAIYNTKKIKKPKIKKILISFYKDKFLF